MKRILPVLLVMGGALLLAAGHVRAESVTVPINRIMDAGVDKALGQVVFADDGKGGLDILVEVAGLPPGPHGMHIHEKPSCAPGLKDGKNVAGLAAGGHFDPAHSGKHEGPGKPGHKGDLPFITADAQGTAKAKLHAPGLTTAEIRGRSLMIHAGGDNYADVPAPLGGGGARIACGVIK